MKLTPSNRCCRSAVKQVTIDGRSKTTDAVGAVDYAVSWDSRMRFGLTVTAPQCLNYPAVPRAAAQSLNYPRATRPRAEQC